MFLGPEPGRMQTAQLLHHPQGLLAMLEEGRVAEEGWEMMQPDA